MNGGNISGGPKSTSGSDIVSTTKKWQKKIDDQKAANNLLSDKLRAMRATFHRAREGILVRDKELCDNIRGQREDMRRMRDVIQSLMTDDTIIDPEVIKIMEHIAGEENMGAPT